MVVSTSYFAHHLASLVGNECRSGSLCYLAIHPKVRVLLSNDFPLLAIVDGEGRFLFCCEFWLAGSEVLTA